MKVSLKAVKQYLDFELPAVGELVEKIGAQLGAVEEMVDLGKKYQGIIIVKVVSCQKHPDADKLQVCRVDAGKGDPVQVVCGAPNVHEGMLAAWLPPGTTVPSTVGKDPLVLEAREIRGQKSNGMLASPKELDLGDSHDGLLVLDDGKPGDDFSKVYELDDTIIDIENKMFTHRPDCFGFMGVARELAGIQHKSFKSPDWYKPNPVFPAVATGPLPFKINNEVPELVPRFTAITLGDVKVGPSPTWLQIALNKLDQKPINNIVDLTNYYMLLTGQPLHAYDYDKVKALSSGNEATIVVRNPKPGEKIKLLNSKEIKPRAEAIMIATDKQLIGIGGVMGGAETEVDENTKNIILECANFDMYSIRRTSMEHGLFTDAVTRFTKGQSPLQCLAVLNRITDDILELGIGEVASHEDDNNHLDKNVLERNSPYRPVIVSASFINARLGLELTIDEMKKLLENVEFKVEAKGEELTIVAPFWRTDIELREDVVEEIGRLYGYDHLPLALPKRDLTPAPKDALLELKSKIRAQLAKAGANEVLTYSFVHGDLLDKVGQNKAQAFQINNALSPDLQYYRLSLIPSLLEKVHPNIKAGYDEFALFELGKVHVNGKEADDLPTEFERLALVFVNGKAKTKTASYYQARKYLIALLDSLHAMSRVSFKTLGKDDEDIATKYYQTGRSATVCIGDQVIGRIGEYKASVSKALKLPANCAGFELGLSQLLEQGQSGSYVSLPRFPKVTQDITLKVAADLAYQELYDFVWAELNKLQPKNALSALKPLDIFQSDNDKNHKNVTLRLNIASYDRTLTDPEVNKLLDTVAAAAKTKFDAERA